MNIQAELFLTFAKIGVFTFGGGYAMIPLIEDLCVEKKKWITHEDMMNITVIAESTPGPIAINCATFVGYKQAGVKGAAAATVGVILPSFVIIYFIAMFFEHFLEIHWVAKAFQGIKVAVGLLITRAGINMARALRADVVKNGNTMHEQLTPQDPEKSGQKKETAVKKNMTIFIFAAAAILTLLTQLFSWNISILVIMLASGIIGLLCEYAPELIAAVKSRRDGDH